MITIIECDQNLVKLLYFNSFVVIKILLHYDCFNKNSGYLDTAPFAGNFDSIFMFLHGYELLRTGLCSFELVAGGISGCRWFQVVLDGFRWFWMVSGGFGWFIVLVVTSERACFHHSCQDAAMLKIHCVIIDVFVGTSPKFTEQLFYRTFSDVCEAKASGVPTQWCL